MVRQAGTIIPYKAGSVLTGGFDGAAQAHHLAEQRYLKMLGYDLGEAPSVILSKGDHETVGKVLNDSRAAMKDRIGNATPSIDDLSKLYHDAYNSIGHPEWADAAERFLRDGAKSK